MTRRSRAPLARAVLRGTGTIALGALCVAYIVWKIDVQRTAEILSHARVWPLTAAILIWLTAIWPFAWRWKVLLRARGVDAPLGWLVRTYFVSYAASQLLPTSLGGDATRIYSGSRRFRGRSQAVVGSVLMERIIGGVVTLVLAALGLALAIGSFDIGPYLWVESVLVLATVVVGILIFSRRMRRPLARLRPVLRRLRLDRTAATVYEGLHGYRHHRTALAETMTLTLFVQAARVLGIWLLGKSVGVDLSPRPYYVMGPLLFLVMLVPFTINGLAIREAMFVNFLGQLGIGADPAFATGFLFFLLSVVVALPGAAILAFEAGMKLLRRTRVQPETSSDDREQDDRGRDSGLQRGEAPRRDARGRAQLR